MNEAPHITAQHPLAADGDQRHHEPPRLKPHVRRLVAAITRGIDGHD
jgi:hypothetical protein